MTAIALYCQNTGRALRAGDSAITQSGFRVRIVSIDKASRCVTVEYLDGTRATFHSPFIRAAEFRKAKHADKSKLSRDKWSAAKRAKRAAIADYKEVLALPYGALVPDNPSANPYSETEQPDLYRHWWDHWFAQWFKLRERS
jgi:preprotein translocase subunit YajC